MNVDQLAGLIIRFVGLAFVLQSMVIGFLISSSVVKLSGPLAGSLAGRLGQALLLPAGLLVVGVILTWQSRRLGRLITRGL